MQRFSSLSKDFERLGIQLVVISPDTVQEAARMKERRMLSQIVLSDVNLEITNKYRLLHAKALTPVRGPIRDLAVPSTIYIGADGKVKWMDVAEDYRCRTDPLHVLYLVRELSS